MSAWRHTVSDCGSTPATAQNTATAPSSTRKRALDFDREVDVAGRVDDVDAVVGEGLVDRLPEAGGRSRGDRDAALLLLLHVVHGGRAVVDFADPVRDARVEKDALRRGGLARVDVGHDPDVAVGSMGGSRAMGANVQALRARCSHVVTSDSGERLVGVGHLMDVFALLHGGARFWRLR